MEFSKNSPEHEFLDCHEKLLSERAKLLEEWSSASSKLQETLVELTFHRFYLTEELLIFREQLVHTLRGQLYIIDEQLRQNALETKCILLKDQTAHIRQQTADVKRLLEYCAGELSQGELSQGE
jgi:hypothetical protein